MKPRYEATRAALEHFDRVEQPALEVLRKRNGAAVNLAGFTDARKVAADKVRAAFLADTPGVNTPEIVEVMSVERIRKAVRNTLLGQMLGFLP